MARFKQSQKLQAGSRLTARTGAVGCPVAITVVVPATAVRATAHTR